MNPDPLGDKKLSEVKFIGRGKLCASDAPSTVSFSCLLFSIILTIQKNTGIKNCSIDNAEGPYCPNCEWYPHKELHGWAAACAKNVCNRGYTVDTEDGCKCMYFD